MSTQVIQKSAARTFAPSRLHRYFASFACLCLLSIWAPAAFASLSCEIALNGPSATNVNASGTTTFSVDVVNGGACGATVDLNFTVGGDTTGGLVLPAGPVTITVGTTYTFNATAGATPGGLASFSVDCITGCVNGVTAVPFTLATNNVFAFTATSGTTVTTNQSTPFTLSSNLLVNGLGSGNTYQTDFLTLPSGPSLGTPTNDAAGNASVTSTIFTVGTTNVQGSVVCPSVPGCPPPALAYTVVVEAVAMTPVSASAVTIAAGASTTLTARYGGTTTVVPVGYNIFWGVTTGNPPGDGALSGTTNTNAAGQTQATFTATVPGVYTVTASSGDTWSTDPTEVFTITVSAITRTLAVSSGNGQSAPTSTALPAPLVALAQDNAVNAPGITINWAVVSGSATLTAATSVTNAGGLANIGVNLGAIPGPIVITGTRADDATAIATFNINSTLVRTLVISSGNSQNATPGSALPAPLVVNAQNNGLAAAGVTINWTITPGSTLGAAASVTSGAGAASNTATLSATPGAVSITATRQDDPTVFVTFSVNGISLASIPGLNKQQLTLAIALDDICTNLNALNSPTAGQADFKARCQELAGNAANNPSDVTTALDELLPDSEAALARASMLTASQQFQTINARIAALRSGTQGSSFGGLALNAANGSVSLGGLVDSLTGESKATEVGADFQRWGFFVAGTIGNGDANAAGITPSYDFDINGLTFGVDYRQSDKFIFGAAFGYSNQNTDVTANQGSIDGTSYTLSAYGTYFQNNNWYTDTVLTIGTNNYDLQRNITYTIPAVGGGFTTVNQTAVSDSGGDLLSFGATFGRDFQKGGWNIGPYGRVLYTKLKFDQIQETLVGSGPGSGLGLIIEDRSLDSLASIIGGKFTRAYSTSWGVLTPQFQFEWEHEFLSDPGSATARFINDPTGTEIVLSDTPYDSNFYRIGLGLAALMSKGRSGFIYYERTVGRDGIGMDNLALGLRLEF